MNISRYTIFTILGGLAMLGLSGCGSSDSSSSGGSSGRVQLLNTVIDAPNLTVEISDSDGDVIETISTFGFRQSSTLLTLTRGSYEVDVYFEDPDTGFEERLLSSDIDVRRNTIYTGLLSGEFANSQLNWYEKPVGTIADTDDELELQVFNLSDATVAVYVGDTSAGLNSETSVATVASGNVTDPIEFVFDEDADYHVRLTADGSSDLLFDSGVVQFSESTRATIVVNEGVRSFVEGKTVSLMRDSGTTYLSNDLAPADFLVINTVADAADVGVNVAVSATGEVLVEDVLALDGYTQFVSLDPEFVDVQVRAPSTEVSTRTATVSLSADQSYSIVIAGSVFDDEVSIRANEMDLRSVANSMNVHFINGLRETDDEDVSEVDVYALPLGDSLSDTAPIATSVNYLEGQSVVIGATPYDLVVTTAGTLSILAGPARIFPDGGERLLAVATESAGGGRPYRIELAVNAGEE